jgi:prepilin-type N-terminal cleavage/methylation domain-containing protein
VPSNKKGFSLIELMIVVGLIAILASFAGAEYRHFQIRSRQKEGLNMLVAYYQAVKSVEGEAGLPGNFVAIGFNPSGQLHYRVSAADGVNPISGPNNDSCINTITNCGGFGDWSEVTTGLFRADTPTNCTATTTAGTFTTCASAIVRNGAGSDVDTWSINEMKSIVQTNDGAL